MRLKLLLRNLSVSAPRVRVRSQLPWPIRALLGFLVLACAAAAGVAIYEYGRQFAGPDRRDLTVELERAHSQLRELKAERDRYAAVSAAQESQVQVERAAQEQLAKQVSELEAESNRLKEDLTFFESLLPTGAGAKGVLIRSFRVQPEGEPNQLRYRLLVQQAGKPVSDFRGSVEMQVSFTQAGRAMVLSVPGTAVGANTALDLSFRHYQRVEGFLTLPAGAVAQSVLVRVVSDGQTKVQQSFTL